MSGAATIAAVAAVAGTAYSVYSGERAAAAQEKAMKQQQQAQQQALEQSKKQAAVQDQEINRANAKSPDSMSVLSRAQQDAQSGGGGTMLTGPTGVDPSLLSLGKSTLLGG